MKKQSQKEYIVIGLGRFGSSIALQLEANGCKVLAIDRSASGSSPITSLWPCAWTWQTTRP